LGCDEGEEWGSLFWNEMKVRAYPERKPDVALAVYKLPKPKEHTETETTKATAKAKMQNDESRRR